MTRFSLAALALIALPTAAAAQDGTAPQYYEAISVSELNLSTPAGRAAVEQRISAAANRVCRVADANNWQEAMQARSCRRVALSGARRQIEQVLAAARDHGSSVRLSSAAR